MQKQTTLIAIMLITGIFWSNHVLAAHVELYRAQRVAENWLQHQVWHYGDWIESRGMDYNTDLSRIKDVEEVHFRDRLVAYNFLVYPSGFILVPARDELPPVKFYATSGTTSFQHAKRIAPFLQWVLHELYVAVEALSAVEEAPGRSILDYSENERLWRKFDTDTSDFQNSVLRTHYVTLPLLQVQG